MERSDIIGLFWVLLGVVLLLGMAVWLLGSIEDVLRDILTIMEAAP